MTAPHVNKIDFKGIAAAVLASSETLVSELLPDGKRNGAEWTARNPTRDDRHPGSFKVNLDSGIWRDFSTEDGGGDLISLYAYLHRVDQGTAARELAERFGLAGDTKSGKRPKSGNDWTAVLPIPADAPLPLAAHPHHGQPTKTWTYHDADGHPLFHVYRFDPPDARKQFCPLCWCRSANGGMAWRWQAVTAPRPLYGLDRLAARPEAPVMVCEGEKAADAAGELLPDWIAVTSAGGAQAPKQSDWTPLRGRRVAIWPDHDEPGQRYAAAVAKLAKASGAADVRILQPDQLGVALPDGWDAADAIEDHWTTERLAALLATPDETPEPTASSQRKVTLNVIAGDFPELCDATETALIDHEPNVFQRSNELVRVMVSRAETVHGICRPGGKTLIAAVDTEHLLDRMNRHIRWQRWSHRKSAWAACNAPRPVATNLLARAGAWRFRSLVGVVTAPTLRPDGSVIDQPGYDPVTGLLFVPHGVDFPAIPIRPTHEQGRAALDLLLREVLNGFPFAEPHDRSAALSAILTACVRHALRSAPLHAFEAPRAGSGKSLLADVVSLIATGATATVMTFTPDPEELRKRILAVLMQGESVINLDNIEGPLHGESLCTVLTGESFSERLLGTNKTATAPTVCTWLATGNNLTLQGDMTRRVIPCQLDPQCERPEERQFSRNLYEWIPKHRPALVVAALTALRAYLVAGRPRQPIATFGSFEQWSDLVRSALVWLGEADPNQGRARLETTDSIGAKLRGLMMVWYAAFKTAPATGKEAVSRAHEKAWVDGRETRAYLALHEVLSEYFSDRRGEISARLLGEFLKRYARRIEHGARFEPAEKYGTRQKWRVAVVEPKALEAALQIFSS
jgi:putative DNA primase/helicase